MSKYKAPKAQICTVEPCYNKDLGTMKITLLYQVSHHIRVRNNTHRNIKSWDQQNYQVARVVLYSTSLYSGTSL